MNFKTDKILLNQDVERKKDIFAVEDSVIIPDIKPDILSIIETSSNLYVYKKELNNGKIKIDGGIQLNTIYTADDENNNIMAIHNTMDFSKVIEIQRDDIENCTFSCLLSVKSIDSKIINGRKVGIKANIEYEIIVYSNKEIEYVSEINDNDESIQMIESKVDIDILKYKGETICSAKETVGLEDSLADILRYNIYVRNKEQKISYNKILSKAECVVDLLYIDENNVMKNISVAIPVMGFIDVPGVSEEELSLINYDIRNIEIKPDSINDKSVLIDVDFLVNCELYEKRSINMIQDLYSPEEELTLYQENVNISQNREILTSNYDISEKINVPDAKDNRIYITKISRNIDQRITSDSINYEGSIDVEFFVESNITNRLELKNKSIDIYHKIKFDENINQVINTDFEIYNEESRATHNGEQELSIGIKFIVNKYTVSNICLINNIKAEEMNQNKRQYSLAIYFVKEGDSLWKIAKKFKTTIDEIVEVNEIEDVDKLNIGDQLFIPRHVCKCIC